MDGHSPLGRVERPLDRWDQWQGGGSDWVRVRTFTTKDADGCVLSNVAEGAATPDMVGVGILTAKDAGVSAEGGAQ